jgi:acryloyl-coenzyme A reductase
MKAVVLEEVGAEPVYREIDKPIVSEEDDVLIKIERTGVCYRDLLTVDGFFPRVKLPIILGHEIAGRVIEVGDKVSKVGVGDRIVSLTYIPCGECDYCRSGRENLCINRKWFGEDLHGSYAEYVLTKEKAVVKIPENVGWNEAAISACVTGMLIHGFEDMAKISSGEVVLVTGAGGGVGIHAIQVAKAYNTKVIAVTTSEEKIKYIEKARPDEIIVSKDDFSKEIKKRFGGVDLVLESVGEPTFRTSLKSLKWGGRIVVVGNVNVKPVNLNLGIIILRENMIIGNLSSTIKSLEKALTLYQKGLVKAIGSVYPLKQATYAHKLLRDRKSIGRIMLKP